LALFCRTAPLGELTLPNASHRRPIPMRKTYGLSDPSIFTFLSLDRSVYEPGPQHCCTGLCITDWSSRWSSDWSNQFAYWLWRSHVLC
jgi:hypothetical protein